MLTRDLFAVANFLVTSGTYCHWLFVMCTYNTASCLCVNLIHVRLGPTHRNFKTRSSADADISARRIQRSKSPNIAPFHMLAYSFLLVCNSNFVFKTRRFSDIRFQKCRDLEIWVKGHSWSFEMSPFERAHNMRSIEWYHFQWPWVTSIWSHMCRTFL